MTEKIKTLLAFVGLLAVLYSVFWFTSETPFPGASPLIPVVGTSFLLFSEIGSLTGIGKFFSLPLMVRIGLISYPMYLWHWPIISLLRQFQIDSTQPVIAVTIVFATIVLAEITYRFVESPIRQRRWFPDNYLLLVSSTVGFAFVVLFGMHLWISDGASYRYSPIARSFLTAPMLSQSNRLGFAFRVLHPKDEVGTLREDITTDRRILLWGNSHADMWSGLLMDMTKENKSSLYLNARNCRATTDSDFCCDKVQQSILDFIVSKRITDVILASTWHGSYDITDEVFERQFREVVKRISSRSKRVWLVIDVPKGKSLDPLVAYDKNPEKPQFGFVLYSEYQKQRKKQLSLFQSLMHSLSNVHIIDPSINLCNDALCNDAICPGGIGNHPWYRDENHLTNAGAKVARMQFLPVFKEDISGK